MKTTAADLKIAAFPAMKAARLENKIGFYGVRRDGNKVTAVATHLRDRNQISLTHDGETITYRESNAPISATWPAHRLADAVVFFSSALNA